MKISESGLTLINLKIVVAIIGVLASIVIPAYQDYVIREQVSEGLTLADDAKAAIAEYYMERRDWPPDNYLAGLDDKHNIIGKYTEHVEVEDNVIEIKYGHDSHGSIFDETITLSAIDNIGAVGWICTSSGVIAAKHLPTACR